MYKILPTRDGIFKTILNNSNSQVSSRKQRVIPYLKNKQGCTNRLILLFCR